MVSIQMNAAAFKSTILTTNLNSLSSLFLVRADANNKSFASVVSVSLLDSARAETGANKVRARRRTKNNSCCSLCCGRGGGWAVRGEDGAARGDGTARGDGAARE